MKITLKRGEVAAAYEALELLDGRERVVSKDGNETVVIEPYRLGVTRLAIVRNLHALKPARQELLEASDGLIKEVTGGKNLINQADDPASFSKFNELMTRLMDDVVEVEIVRIKASELKLEQNDIPPRVVVALGPVLDLEG